MNLIITSEQRVGSRWMHYLFADVLGKQPSPEIDGNRFYDGSLDEIFARVQGYLAEGRIPKFHGVGVIALDRFLKARGLTDFGILGVVRNPFDRAVSLAFHNRYHKKHPFKAKEFDTDEEAVNWTVAEDDGFQKSNVRQYSDLMLPYFSTYTNWYPANTINYVWTTYEWLKEDTGREVKAIIDKLSIEVPVFRADVIDILINKHSFKSKSGRTEGQEQRNDLWRRKGIVGDHANWFNKASYIALNPYQYRYNYMVALEKSGKLEGIPII